MGWRWNAYVRVLATLRPLDRAKVSPWSCSCGRYGCIHHRASCGHPDIPKVPPTTDMCGFPSVFILEPSQWFGNLRLAHQMLPAHTCEAATGTWRPLESSICRTKCRACACNDKSARAFAHNPSSSLAFAVSCCRQGLSEPNWNASKELDAFQPRWKELRCPLPTEHFLPSVPQ